MDMPFFRGENRMDYLFAVLLQTACDWSSVSEIQSVLSLLEPGSVKQYSDPAGIYPTVTVCVTQNYIFVASASTHTDIQWIGNVLGSAAVSVPPAGGTVSAYFGTGAKFAYLATHSIVTQSIAGRNLVFLGFSLGGANVTILSDMYRRADGAASAVVSFGSPRPGTTDFAAGFDSSNYHLFGLVNDVVPSVPPTIWAGLGLRNAWTPFPPFVTYTHPTNGTVLLLDGSLRPGIWTVPVEEVILGFDTGTFLSFHNQSLYARTLRKLDIPDPIPAGYEGYAGAADLDKVAFSLFTFGGPQWPYGGPPNLQLGVANMTVQLTIGIRDRNTPPRGADEIYYFNSGDPIAIRNLAVSAVSPNQPWVNLRAAFLTNSAEIYYVRAALVGGVRQSILYKLPQPLAGSLGVSEDLGNSVDYYAYSANRYSKRLLQFRGIDSNWITADALTSTGNTQRAKINPFLDAMIANGFSIYALQGNVITGKPFVSAAKATQSSLITLTMADNTVTYPADSLIVVSGCRANRLLNATWKVAGPVVAGQVTLAGSANFSVPPTINGVIRPDTKNCLSIPSQSYEFNAVGYKKCGRPRFQRRGRRSVQIVRR